MGTVGATDHLMLIAVVSALLHHLLPPTLTHPQILTWGNTVINYYQDSTSSHFRPSQFKHPEKKASIEAALHDSLVTWYIYRVTYVVALLFVKLSILFFYRAIASHATFRRFVYYTMTLVSLYTFAASLASIFQCDKISGAWDTSAYLSQFDGVPGRTKGAKCYEPTKLWVVTGAVNLFSDVLILLLPIPTLLGLRVPINKRLALIGIFSIGVMAIVASCVRMWVMALWSESPQNSAQFGADLLLWGQVETNSGIISASVPFLRLIFRGRGGGDSRSEQRRGGAGHAGAGEKKVVGLVSPPEMAHGRGSDNKPLQMDSMAFFEPGQDEGPGSPMWKPFITVPASLSSGSRGSELLEPTRVGVTV
jgi:hypothetical protein